MSGTLRHEEVSIQYVGYIFDEFFGDGQIFEKLAHVLLYSLDMAHTSDWPRSQTDRDAKRSTFGRYLSRDSGARCLTVSQCVLKSLGSWIRIVKRRQLWFLSKKASSCLTLIAWEWEHGQLLSIWCFNEARDSNRSWATIDRTEWTDFSIRLRERERDKKTSRGCHCQRQWSRKKRSIEKSKYPTCYSFECSLTISCSIEAIFGLSWYVFSYKFQ